MKPALGWIHIKDYHLRKPVAVKGHVEEGNTMRLMPAFVLVLFVAALATLDGERPAAPDRAVAAQAREGVLASRESAEVLGLRHAIDRQRRIERLKVKDQGHQKH